MGAGECRSVVLCVELDERKDVCCRGFEEIRQAVADDVSFFFTHEGGAAVFDDVSEVGLEELVCSIDS